MDLTICSSFFVVVKISHTFGEFCKYTEMGDGIKHKIKIFSKGVR